MNPTWQYEERWKFRFSDIDNWCYFSNKPSANIWTEMPENYMSLNIPKTKTWKWIDKSSVWPVFSPFDLSIIASGLSCLQNERWLWYSWLCSSRLSGYCLSLQFTRTLIFEWCQVYHKMRFQIFHFMLYADFGEPGHANQLNNRKLQKHQIHCNLCLSYVLISTNVQISDQNALHDSNQVLPCNRFFHFSARSNCPSPENFWLSIFHPPDIFISGKRPKTWFQGGAFYWFWTGDWL